MPNANDLITLRKPPPKRVDKTEGDLENETKTEQKTILTDDP